MDVLLVNGPNLGLLGLRKPELYGRATLADIETRLGGMARTAGLRLRPFQSNSEGALIDFLNDSYRAHAHGEAAITGLIINPGALAHTSIAMRDALELFRDARVPVFEVHLSNIHARESFRHVSLSSQVVSGVLCGFGPRGYEMALAHLLDTVKDAVAEGAVRKAGEGSLSGGGNALV